MTNLHVGVGQKAGHATIPSLARVKQRKAAIFILAININVSVGQQRYDYRSVALLDGHDKGRNASADATINLRGGMGGIVRS